jgi:predicted Ser/Thr protein kinase
MYVLEHSIRREQLPEEIEKRYLEFIKAELVPRYAEFIGHEIQKAYLESYSDYGQNLFDRYVDYADAWIEDQDFKDPDTGQLLNRELLNQELTKIEKPAGIANPKDFRNEVVKFSLLSQHGGKNPSWTTMRRFAKSSRSGYSRRSKTFFRLSRLAQKRTARPKRSTASLSSGWWGAVIPSARFAGSSNGICA